jgi:hypothetical protein
MTVRWTDGTEAAFEFPAHMGGDDGADEFPERQPRHKIAGQAKKAAESGFAQKRPILIDGAGIEAGEQARCAADPEHTRDFDTDAHGVHGHGEFARPSPTRHDSRRGGCLAFKDPAGGFWLSTAC